MHFFSLERRYRAVLVTFSGSLTEQDLLDHDRAARAIRERYGYERGIVDFSGVTEVEVPTAEFVRRARRTPSMGEVQRVFVVPQPAMFGLARVFTSHHQIDGNNEPVLVRTLAEACAALSLDTPHFEPVEDG
jgi:hypothetical protein